MTGAMIRFTLIVLLAGGCAQSATEAGGADSASTPDADAIGNTGDGIAAIDIVDTAPPAFVVDAAVNAHPRSPLAALVEVSTGALARVRVRAFSGDETPRVTPWSDVGDAHEVEVLGLLADTTWDLEIEAKSVEGEVVSLPSISFQSGSLPPGMPVMEITAHEADLVAPGLTFFGVAQLEKPNDPALPLYVAVDALGRVVWLYQDEETDHDAAARGLHILDDGNLLLVVGAGFRVVTPGGKVLTQISGGPHIGGAIHHDAVPLDNGHFLALVRAKQTVDVEVLGGEVEVKGDRVIEITPHGDVLWSWSAFDHLDTQRFPTALSRKAHPKDGSYDWTHGNALVALEGGDFLLSMRHQHQVARIARPSGDVTWLLGDGGDFTLESGTWFYGQHNPQVLEDGTILVYDNGNDRPGDGPAASRGAGYALDEDTMTASQVFDHPLPEYTSFLGGIQGLDNGSVLICAGGVRSNAPGPKDTGPVSGTARLIEVAASGEEVWRLEVKGNIYRARRAHGLLWMTE